MLKKRITLFLNYDELMLLIYALGQFIIACHRVKSNDIDNAIFGTLEHDAISLIEKICEVSCEIEKEI